MQLNSPPVSQLWGCLLFTHVAQQQWIHQLFKSSDVALGSYGSLINLNDFLHSMQYTQTPCLYGEIIVNKVSKLSSLFSESPNIVELLSSVLWIINLTTRKFYYYLLGLNSRACLKVHIQAGFKLKSFYCDPSERALKVHKLDLLHAPLTYQ